MTILISISGGAIDRIVKETYRSEVIPEIAGRIGRSNLLHMCYSARLTSAPEVEVTRAGALTVSVPVEGMASIPWGVGMKFRMKAATDVGLAIEGEKVKVELGKVTFQNLKVGNGCFMPREFLDILGPFVHGVALKALFGPGGGLAMDLPAIQIPLSEVMPETISEMMPEAKPIEVKINNILAEPPGMVVDISMAGDEASPAPLPAQEGWDVVMSICETTAELMVERAMEMIGDIKGDFSVPVPDPRAMADVFVASAETLTTLGRRGLGRRGLRNASEIKVEYVARTGRPNLCFQEGGKIAVCNIPAHLVAKAFLEMERSKGSILDRLRAFFRPSAGRATQVEKATLGSWDVEEDLVIERAEITIEQGSGELPKIKLTSLDIDFDLPWPLPSEILEKIVEGIGKGVMSSRLPQAIPTEFPLPPEIMPFKVKLEGLQISTVEGILIVRSNVSLKPVGSPEEVKQALIEKMKEIVPDPQMIACNELTTK